MQINQLLHTNYSKIQVFNLPDLVVSYSLLFAKFASFQVWQEKGLANNSKIFFLDRTLIELTKSNLKK